MAHETTYEYRYMYLNYGTTEPMRDGGTVRAFGGRSYLV